MAAGGRCRPAHVSGGRGRPAHVEQPAACLFSRGCHSCWLGIDSPPSGHTLWRSEGPAHALNPQNDRQASPRSSPDDPTELSVNITKQVIILYRLYYSYMI